MRVFIAISLPEDIKAKIFHNFEKIKDANIIKGNFVEKENLHLTLKFIGDVSEEKINQIDECLSKIKFKIFEAKIGKVGFFSNENHINVVWVEFVSDKVNELQKLIDFKLNELGFTREKDFSSHITAIRVKTIKNRDLFLSKVKDINLKNLRFEVKDFSLIKSELKREGPSYKLIKKFSLTN